MRMKNELVIPINKKLKLLDFNFRFFFIDLKFRKVKKNKKNEYKNSLLVSNIFILLRNFNYCKKFLTGAQSTLVKEENNNKIKSKPLLLSKINKKRKKYIYILKTI